MIRLSPALLALALSSAVLPLSRAARAQSAALDPSMAAPATVHVKDDTEAPLPLIPREPDLLGSHVLVGAGVAPVWALGSLGSALGAGRGLGTGLGFRGDAGIGVSRSVALGVWGTYTSYGNGDTCPSDCSGRAFTVGPFVRYHLSQGLRFDPWLSLGGGYRQLSFDAGTGPRQKFSGVEWLRLELGADYYALSSIGISPYGALGLSTFTSRPAAAGDASVSTELSVGLRLFLDAPGR